MTTTLLICLAASFAIGLAYAIGRVHGAAPLELELHQLHLAAEQQKEHYDEVTRRLNASLAAASRLAGKRAAAVVGVVRAPVYRNECIDDAGLRIANEALANAPDSATVDVPSTDAACGGDGSSTSSETCGN